MSALEILIKLIKDSEGCKLKAYKCPAGIWTIGYGQTKGVKEGMVWTQQQAD
jgi:lysozyme